MDIKYLYSHIENVEQCDRIDRLYAICKNFNECKTIDILPCITLFNDNQIYEFIEQALEFLNIKSDVDDCIAFIKSFKGYQRCEIFKIYYNFINVPLDVYAMCKILILLKHNDDDMLLVIDYFTEISITDKYELGILFAKLFVSYDNLKLACSKLLISEDIQEDLKDEHMFFNTSIIIHDQIIPYVRMYEYKNVNIDRM